MSDDLDTPMMDQIADLTAKLAAAEAKVAAEYVLRQEVITQWETAEERVDELVQAHGRVVDRACDAEVALAAAEAERDEYLAMLCSDAKPVEEVVASLKRHLATEAQLAKATAALERITKELGVPGDGYPAPVANAYDIARQALQEQSE